MNENIFDAIADIMQNVNVKKDVIDAGKGGKYNAFTIDSVLDEIRPLLAKNRLIMSIQHRLVENQYIETESQYGKKTKHNVIVETDLILKHKSGEELCLKAIGEGSDNGDKAISKAQTDSYKKIITQMFAISDGDDKDKIPSDNDEKINKVEKKQYEKKPNLEQQTKSYFEIAKASISKIIDIQKLEQTKQGIVDSKKYSLKEKEELVNIIVAKINELSKE